jgi:hypothetical protein
MLEKLNNSVNLLAAVLILTGAIVGIFAPAIGEKLIIGGFGVFTGAAAKAAISPNV